MLDRYASSRFLTEEEAVELRLRNEASPPQGRNGDIGEGLTTSKPEARSCYNFRNKVIVRFYHCTHMMASYMYPTRLV